MVVALALLPDGRLASGSGDCTIRLWDLTSGAETPRFDDHAAFQHAGRRPPLHRGIEALALLPDGRLASASWDGSIRLWDLTSGTETARLEGHYVDQGVMALAPLPDGWVASGGGDSTIRLWDLTSGGEAARLEARREHDAAQALLDWWWRSAPDDSARRLEGHTSTVTALALLPDGRLASGSGDSTIRLWDLISGAETARLEGHTDQVTALRLLPDGRLASASWDKTIRLWDLASGAETARLEGHTGWVEAMVLLPDGRLASASSHIRLWDLKSGAETGRLEGHTSSVQAMVLLPDGRLASASWDRTIRLWNIASSKEIVRLEVDAPVFCLAALPDGRLVAGDQIGRLHWLEIVG